MGTSPRLPYVAFHSVKVALTLAEQDATLKSGMSESNRNPPLPKRGVLPTALHPIDKVDELGVEPRSLECKSKRRPVGKPILIKAARVGFEPDLSGLKNQRPHQKSNEPCCFVFPVSFCKCAVFSAVVSTFCFLRFIASGLGGARTLVCGSSDHAIPSQLPVHFCLRGSVGSIKTRKNPVSLEATPGSTYERGVALVTQDHDVTRSFARL